MYCMGILSKITDFFRGRGQARSIRSSDAGAVQPSAPRTGGSYDYDALLSFIGNESAMRVATVYRCVNHLADAVANLPMQYMRRKGDIFVEDENSRFYQLLNFQPDGCMSAVDFWQQLGSNPTPMNFSEVYIGLQQHTIDAQENPYEVIVSNRLYEQQDYIIETNHVPHLISLVVSEDFYQDLPEEDQQILVEAEAIAKEYAREQSDERIDERIQIIRDSGTEIITPGDEVREQMIEASEPVYEEIQEVVDPEIYSLYTQNEQ